MNGGLDKNNQIRDNAWPLQNEVKVVQLYNALSPAIKQCQKDLLTVRQWNN